MTPAHDTPVIGYARVSTEEQGDSGAGLDAQEAAIRAECERRGWRLVALHREVGSGRTTARRPLLAQSLEALESKDPDAPKAIVVAKLDRLTRSVADGARLFDRAARKGWGIVALDLGVDTTTPAGELVANVMVAVGQWERRVISERTRAGLAAKRAQGVVLGRPRVLSPEVIEMIRDFRSSGLSDEKVAQALNEAGVPGAQGGRWFKQSVAAARKRYGIDVKRKKVKR